MLTESAPVMQRLESPNLKDVSRLLSLTKSKSDESKLAGLMLIPRFVQPNDESTMMQVMQSVGFPFIVRLLSSPGSPGDPTDGSCMYQVLALNFLSTLCVFQNAQKEVLKSNHCLAVPLILLNFLDDDQMRNSSFIEIATIAKTLATSPTHRRRFNDAKAPRRIARLMGAVDDDEMATALTHLFDAIIDADHHPSAAVDAVPTLAQVFFESRTLTKFDAFTRLIGILSHPSDAVEAAFQSIDRSWHAPLRDQLMLLLRNRVPPRERQAVLLCAESMFQRFGPDWALLPCAGDACGGAPEKFAQLLVSVCNVEARVRQECPLQAQDNYLVIPACLSLLEHVLHALEDEEREDNGWPRMSPHAGLHLRRQLEESTLGGDRG